MRSNTGIAAAVLVHILVACSASPEATGGCTLNCSKPRVGDAAYQITPLVAVGQEEQAMKCEADFQTAKSTIVPTNLPVQVKYLIYEQVPAPFGGGGAAPAGGAAGGLALASALEDKRPASSVSFEPWVIGSMAVSKTVADFRDANNNPSPAKYAGIVTPPSEWCSDSCGVITYEFWPNCMQGGDNTVTASVLAGGAAPTKELKYDITESGTN